MSEKSVVGASSAGIFSQKCSKRRAVLLIFEISILHGLIS